MGPIQPCRACTVAGAPFLASTLSHDACDAQRSTTGPGLRQFTAYARWIWQARIDGARDRQDLQVTRGRVTGRGQARRVAASEGSGGGWREKTRPAAVVFGGSGQCQGGPDAAAVPDRSHSACCCRRTYVTVWVRSGRCQWGPRPFPQAPAPEPAPTPAAPAPARRQGAATAAEGGGDGESCWGGGGGRRGPEQRGQGQEQRQGQGLRHVVRAPLPAQHSLSFPQRSDGCVCRPERPGPLVRAPAVRRRERGG